MLIRVLHLVFLAACVCALTNCLLASLMAYLLLVILMAYFLLVALMAYLL